MSADAFVAVAARVLEALDNGAAGPVYDAASVVMKQAIGRDAFVAEIAGRRASAGAISSRDWARIERLHVMAPPAVPAAGPSGADAQPPAALPPGDYITIIAIARAANGVRVEQISFHRDEDSQWRLAGVLNLTPGQPPPR